MTRALIRASTAGSAITAEPGPSAGAETATGRTNLVLRLLRRGQVLPGLNHLTGEDRAAHRDV